MLSWGLAGAGLAWYAASVAKEVTYVTLADGRRQERSFPLAFKMLLPFVGNLDGLVSRPTFAKDVAASEALLVAGGYEGLVNGREFVALKILTPVVMGALWCVVIFLAGAVIPDSLFTPSGSTSFDPTIPFQTVAVFDPEDVTEEEKQEEEKGRSRGRDEKLS